MPSSKWVILPVYRQRCQHLPADIYAASAPGGFNSSSDESIFSLQALFAFIAAFPMAAVAVPHTFVFEGVALDALAGSLFFMVVLLFPSLVVVGYPFQKGNPYHLMSNLCAGEQLCVLRMQGSDYTGKI
jgi:hypothetical protein